MFLNTSKDDIEIVKKDWELGRLKALKEEEERRAELEEDEMLYIYSRDDAYNQVKKKSKAQKANKDSAKVVTPSRITPVRNKPKQFIDDEYVPSFGRSVKVTPRVTAYKNSISPRFSVGRSKKSNKVLAKAEAVVVNEEGDRAINVTYKSTSKSIKIKRKVLIDNNVTIPNDEGVMLLEKTPKLVQKKGRGRPSILKQGREKPPCAFSNPLQPVINATSPQKMVQLPQAVSQQAQVQPAKAQQTPTTQPTIAQLMYQAHQQTSSIQFARQSAPTLPNQTLSTSQLLSASQLQHLKQIISKAAHTKLASPKGSTAGIIQTGQPNLQHLTVKSNQTQPAIQLVGHTSVIAQPQTVNVSPQVSQIVNQGQNQTIQYLTQPSSLTSVRPAQAIQQVVSHNSAVQPTLQFIKVNTSNAQQPVLQYCVNTSGGNTGQVRIQNAAQQNQQGVVLLQLGGGKAIPVSLSQRSPLSVPMARLVASRSVANTSQKIGHLVHQNATSQQFVARGVQPTKISAPISRFQTASVASLGSQVFPNNTVLSSPQPHNIPTVVQTRYRIPKIGQQQLKEIPSNTQSAPTPFWNPNLVIRTRKAVAQPDAPKEVVERGVKSDNLPFVIGKSNAHAAQTSSNGGSPNQFISLLKAGSASGQVSNVVIKENAIISSQGMVVVSQANSEAPVTTNGPTVNQVNNVN